MPIFCYNLSLDLMISYTIIFTVLYYLCTSNFGDIEMKGYFTKPLDPEIVIGSLLWDIMDTHCIAHTRRCTGAVSMVDFRRGVPDRETCKTMDHSSIAPETNGPRVMARARKKGEQIEAKRKSPSPSFLATHKRSLAIITHGKVNADRIDSCLTEPDFRLYFARGCRYDTIRSIFRIWCYKIYFRFFSIKNIDIVRDTYVKFDFATYCQVIYIKKYANYWTN